MQNANKLGYYLWKRINQDQENYRKTRPPNIRGLYFNRFDIDSYIKDYFNYGMDWDDTSKEELEEPKYWDERDVDVQLFISDIGCVDKSDYFSGFMGVLG